LVRQLRLSFNSFIKTIILCGYIAFLSWLLATHDIRFYINPRYSYLTELTIHILLLLLIIQGSQIFYVKKKSEDSSLPIKRNFTIYIPFVVSLVLASVLPSSSLDAKLVSMKGFNTRIIAPENQSLPESTMLQLQQASDIQVTDQNYTYILSELTLHPNNYVGKKLTVIGFVYEDSSFPSFQLALVRYVIFCCSADATPYAFICQIPEEERFPTGTWLNVHGTVQLIQNQQKTLPLIFVDSATPIDEPDQPYIYP
jgi:putative membrane protein